jgi:hypothetical protein
MSQYDLDHSAPPQLAELLSLEPAAPENWRPEEFAAILQHQLDGPVEPDPGDATSPDAASAIPLGELLSADRPPLPLLQRAKRFAKACKNHPDAPLPAEVATAIYFATIAAAWLRCGGARISSLPDEQLSAGFRWAVAQPWLSPALVTLFHQALAHSA